jgi:hypothetical protein
MVGKIGVSTWLSGWGTHTFKASQGIVSRPHSDYQVLARRRILSGDVFCVVVGTLTEYDSFEDIPDIVGGVPTFIRRIPAGKCIAVSTTDQSFDSACHA